MKNKIENSFQKIFHAYGGIGRGSLFFCYRWLVFSHQKVSGVVPERGLIYDLGCGYGIFSIYLTLNFSERKIVAVDFSPTRIKCAQRAARNLKLNITFIQDNFFNIVPEPCEAIVLNDVLHHIARWSEQKKLIEKVTSAIRPGGKLIIADVAQQPRWKYYISWLIDHIFYPGAHICYLKDGELKKTLEGLDFQVQFFPVDQNRPYSNFMCIGIKQK